MKGVDYAGMTGGEIRALCRNGSFDRSTAGAAKGYVQANLMIVSADVAADFERFCTRNPRPCPLLEVTQPGVPEARQLAPGCDLRTDLPRYRVLRSGACADRPKSIEEYWDKDSMAFLIGCSFTFEAALLTAGLPVRHLEEGCNVPMYRTKIACESAGPFSGPLIVSMRPMTPGQADEAARITEEYPKTHGAPMRIDETSVLGIDDLSRPDYGDAVTIGPGEVPVFWACGVTPMEALLRAKLDLSITHEPGHMFVTDVLDRNLHESKVAPPRNPS